MNYVHREEQVPSEHRPDHAYRVSATLSCECPGFFTHGYCKHLRAFTASMLAPRSKAARSRFTVTERSQP